MAAGTVEQWYAYFAGKFEMVGKAYRYNYNIEFYKIFLENLVGDSAEWVTPAKDLFLFHGCLFTMGKIENYIRSSPYYYITGAYRSDSDYFIDFLRDTGAKFAQAGEQEAGRPHFNAALNKLREKALQGNNLCFDWLAIYQRLWSDCFSCQQLIDKESAKLEMLLRQKHSEAILTKITAARAHLLFLAGNDQKAMKILEENKINISYLFYYLKTLFRHKELRRLENWLRWLVPQMQSATYEETRVVSEYWFELAELRQDYGELLTLLKSWLPGSSDMYEKTLVAAGQYKTWVEYHIFHKNMPSDLGREELKRIEKYDAALLLPFYHQAAVRLIQLKNRLAYKNAVRVLKKLENYYIKLKREKEWDFFIKGLASRYRRWRALQDEMRKGQLIDEE